MGSVFLAVLLIICGLEVNFQEAIKGDHLSVCDKFLVTVGHVDGDRRLLNLGICHLGGGGTLPDQVVKPFLLGCPIYLCVAHVGRADSLVGFLCPLGMGDIFAWLAVFLAIELNDLILAGIDA